MALELVKLDSGTLPAIANAIREKTGDTALLLPSQMPNAIAGIPSGIELPALTTPAEDSDVLNGKEYIGAAGEKRTGTLVDQIYEVETLMGPGGISLDVESTAGAEETFEFPEPNLQAENIKSGVMIYGCTGNAKILCVETGTITPAEATLSITIPCTDGAKAFILEATDDTKSAIEGQSLTYAVVFSGNFLSKHNIEAAVNTVFVIWHNAQYSARGTTAQNSGGVTLSLGYSFYPGTYKWEAYYWEDDA